MKQKLPVGILSCQGAFIPYIEALEFFNISYKKITYESDFKDIGGLILPGGESTSQLKAYEQNNLIPHIVEFVKSDNPVLATCAGLIILSCISTPHIKGLGLLDIDVDRNHYGSQLNSGIFKSDYGNVITLIRAPVITRTNPAIEILDKYKNNPVLVKQNNIYGSSFHPEFDINNGENIIPKIFKY